MELLKDKYVQALLVGGAVWHYSKNYRPGLFFEATGHPKVECIGPEALGAISAVLVLGYHSGYFSMKNGYESISPIGPSAAAAQGAAPAELQAMAFSLAPPQT